MSNIYIGGLSDLGQLLRRGERRRALPIVFRARLPIEIPVRIAEPRGAIPTVRETILRRAEPRGAIPTVRRAELPILQPGQIPPRRDVMTMPLRDLTEQLKRKVVAAEEVMVPEAPAFDFKDLLIPAGIVLTVAVGYFALK